MVIEFGELTGTPDDKPQRKIDVSGPLRPETYAGIVSEAFRFTASGYEAPADSTFGTFNDAIHAGKIGPQEIVGMEDHISFPLNAEPGTRDEGIFIQVYGETTGVRALVTHTKFNSEVGIIQSTHRVMDQGEVVYSIDNYVAGKDTQASQRALEAIALPAKVADLTRIDFNAENVTGVLNEKEAQVLYRKLASINSHEQR